MTLSQMMGLRRILLPALYWTVLLLWFSEYIYHLCLDKKYVSGESRCREIRPAELHGVVRPVDIGPVLLAIPRASISHYGSLRYSSLVDRMVLFV